MTIQPLTSDIIYLGANDHDIKKFEALWAIPQGVSYNAYLIQDKKTALIDTVEERFADEFLQELEKLLKNKSLDYLILNHMEPDHSGTLKLVKDKYPQVQIVGNHKTAGFVQGFYNLPQDQVLQIKTGDQLELGTHSLKFYQTPMVHWPESMVTYDPASKILFSSDFFGGYKTVDDQPLADERQDLDEFIEEAREYFATVLGAHTRPAGRVFKQLDQLEIKAIAPGHGLVWQKSKDKIYQLYQDWTNYQARPAVTIVYGSMYGHTQKMAELLAAELTANKIESKLLNAAQTDLSEILNAVWQNQGLVIASCTYTNDAFPPIQALLHALDIRTLQNRYFAYFGSYSWTGGAFKALKKFAQDSKMELVEPSFRVQYSMGSEEKSLIKQLAQNLAQKLK
jgi:flavorubredoxin